MNDDKRQEELGKSVIKGFASIILFFIVSFLCLCLYNYIGNFAALPKLSYWFFAGTIYVIRYIFKGAAK